MIEIRQAQTYMEWVKASQNYGLTMAQSIGCISSNVARP
ncbi:hypothetical protein XM38_035500 [Halomicronema hongdechloris C2206]|uniref:Uncharacterized protein n=1 Tax=Halomicronema hongdechloris C2206 TaxID=1641165 RepID=A0A1Z3HQR0_9CYAN|nr:hypothetical protein XM38_035500 [Halomicronema hongdechloris C2206]